MTRQGEIATIASQKIVTAAVIVGLIIVVGLGIFQAFRYKYFMKGCVALLEFQNDVYKRNISYSEFSRLKKTCEDLERRD